MLDWKSKAPIETLQLRGSVLAEIRGFFASRNVLEVDTPLLAHATATDVYIQSLTVNSVTAEPNETFYLQTSPEFAMKRLLACGVGPIYQMCKAFRRGETSKRHNPEFTMLEWYQPGYSMSELIDEVEQLVQGLLNCATIPRLSYREIFLAQFEFDPHSISLEELRALATRKMDLSGTDLSKTDYLQLLLGKFIEPELPVNCFIFDYPVDQAALAVVADDALGVPVAKRFELFCNGMELANGYFELVDPIEQRARFEADLKRRRAQELAVYPVDERLIAAMESGIPSCAGVALGVDRLIMLLSKSDDICEVISFTTDRA